MSELKLHPCSECGREWPIGFEFPAPLKCVCDLKADNDSLRKEVGRLREALEKIGAGSLSYKFNVLDACKEALSGREELKP